MASVRNYAKGLAMPLLVLGMTSAQAAMLEGDRVWFSFDDSLTGLFGSASVAGDTLSFNPTEFKATAAGTGIVTVSGTTPLITITAKPSFVLEDLALLEQGNYFRIESGGGTTLVGAGGQFIVNNVAHPVTAGGLTDYLTVDDVTSTGLTTSSWIALADVGVSGTAATVKVQNILLAGITEGLEAAFIEKGLVSIEVGAEIGVVPVPAAVWLFGSALLGLSLVSRRRLAA